MDEPMMNSNETSTPIIKVVVLEDNEFYNKLLSKKLHACIEQIEMELACTVDLISFTSVDDLLTNLETIQQIDVAFIDYYLGDQLSGLDMMKTILNYHPQCSVVVFSRSQNKMIEQDNLNNGALEFIQKDRKALKKLVNIFEDLVFKIFINKQIRPGKQFGFHLN
ncbi:MAG: response regulator [Crocinitomicaceae bacterium]|nr:response regulator [Crocinitomicaceae bacterium]